ncbi:MAG: NAD(P)H-dependent flavin oxidoreductase [Bacteroidales bacterium]
MNRITELLGIRYPIIQGGMVWCSGWELASAVSNAGGLGVIGSGSMYPDVLRQHIRKCKAHTDKPFAVNLPLLYPQIGDHIGIILEEKVPVVITSAGSPSKYTSLFKSEGIKVMHVVAGVKFARKCEEAGVDAIIAEGFEAGGHNGADETTTMVLIPLVKRHSHLPLIAAGGIATGRGMLAAMILGAEGVQLGTRFAASQESSAHPAFKQIITQTGEGGTMLALKKIGAVRLIKNAFYQKVAEAEARGASPEELSQLLGRGRAKKGMFEGDLEEGELEIGQVAALVDDIKPVSQIFSEILEEYLTALDEMKNLWRP